MQYLELLAKRIIYNSEGVAPSLIEGVCTLADKLKFYDPVGDAEEGDELEFGAALETSRPDNSWLKDLRAIQVDCRAAPANQDYEGLHATISTDNTLQQSGYGQDAWQQEQQLYDQQQQMQFELQQQQYQEPTSVWGQEQPNQGGFHSQESQPLLSGKFPKLVCFGLRHFRGKSFESSVLLYYYHREGITQWCPQYIYFSLQLKPVQPVLGIKMWQNLVCWL